MRKVGYTAGICKPPVLVSIAFRTDRSHREQAFMFLTIFKIMRFQTRFATPVMVAELAKMDEATRDAALRKQSVDYRAGRPFEYTQLAKGFAAMNGQCSNPACTRRPGTVKLAICRGCRINMYCGRDCQAAHWPNHKRNCCAAQDARKFLEETPAEQWRNTPFQILFDALNAWVADEYKTK
jgi:hypothetical protein